MIRALALPIFVLAAASVLAGCQTYNPSYADVYEPNVYATRVEPEVYCYRTLGRPNCYITPQPGPPNRLIGRAPFGLSVPEPVILEEAPGAQ